MEVSRIENNILQKNFIMNMVALLGMLQSMPQLELLEVQCFQTQEISLYIFTQAQAPIPEFGRYNESFLKMCRKVAESHYPGMQWTHTRKKWPTVSFTTALGYLS